METGKSLDETLGSDGFLADHALSWLAFIGELLEKSQLFLLHPFPLHILLPIQLQQFLHESYFIVLRREVRIIIRMSRYHSAILHLIKPLFGPFNLSFHPFQVLFLRISRCFLLHRMSQHMVIEYPRIHYLFAVVAGEGGDFNSSLFFFLLLWRSANG